jgi:hypothetical protein
MKLIRTLLCGLLLAITAAPAAFAGDKEFLEALYNRMGAAIASSNADAYMALIDPSIVSIDQKGNRKDVRAVRADIEQLAGQARNFRFKVDASNINNTGSKVTAVVSVAAVFEMQGGPNSGKVFATLFQTDDTWELKGGAWKQTSSRTREAVTKEIPPEIMRQLSQEGAKAAAAQQQPAGAAPQQQPSAKVPAQASKDQTFKKMQRDSCIRHCETMSMNCSMSGGHYFGGKSAFTGIPCMSSQIACTAGC